MNKIISTPTIVLTTEILQTSPTETATLQTFIYDFIRVLFFFFLFNLKIGKNVKISDGTNGTMVFLFHCELMELGKETRPHCPPYAGCVDLFQQILTLIYVGIILKGCWSFCLYSTWSVFCISMFIFLYGLYLRYNTTSSIDTSTTATHIEKTSHHYMHQRKTPPPTEKNMTDLKKVPYDVIKNTLLTYLSDQEKVDIRKVNQMFRQALPDPIIRHLQIGSNSEYKWCKNLATCLGKLEYFYKKLERNHEVEKFPPVQVKLGDGEFYTGYNSYYRGGIDTTLKICVPVRIIGKGRNRTSIKTTSIQIVSPNQYKTPKARNCVIFENLNITHKPKYRFRVNNNNPSTSNINFGGISNIKSNYDLKLKNVDVEGFTFGAGVLINKSKLLEMDDCRLFRNGIGLNIKNGCLANLTNVKLIGNRTSGIKLSNKNTPNSISSTCNTVNFFGTDTEISANEKFGIHFCRKNKKLEDSIFFHLHYDQQDKVIHDNAVSCSDNTSETTRTQSSYSFQTSKRSYDKDLENDNFRKIMNKRKGIILVPQDCPSIKEALKMADEINLDIFMREKRSHYNVEGMTNRISEIQVDEGTYIENKINIRQNISLVGKGIGKTIIKGCIKIEMNLGIFNKKSNKKVNLADFTIMNPNGNGIEAHQSLIKMRLQRQGRNSIIELNLCRCEIKNCSKNGLCLYNKKFGGFMDVIDCHIHHNRKNGIILNDQTLVNTHACRASVRHNDLNTHTLLFARTKNVKINDNGLCGIIATNRTSCRIYGSLTSITCNGNSSRKLSLEEKIKNKILYKGGLIHIRNNPYDDVNDYHTDNYGVEKGDTCFIFHLPEHKLAVRNNVGHGNIVANNWKTNVSYTKNSWKESWEL